MYTYIYIKKKNSTAVKDHQLKTTTEIFKPENSNNTLNKESARRLFSLSLNVSETSRSWSEGKVDILCNENLCITQTPDD